MISRSIYTVVYWVKKVCFGHILSYKETILIITYLSAIGGYPISVKNILISILSVILNTALFFVLEVVAQFTHFFLFGEGASGDKYFIGEALFYTALQMGILYYLFQKKFLIKTNWLLIFNLIIAIGLYYHFNMASTF